ncbi:MAG: Ig-like domain-containing protein [Actinomycetota bacterium]|nr:Ig-like domain-containing protein [Actinomycetota bacterium]
MSVSASALPTAPPSPVTTGFATINNLTINGIPTTIETVAPGSSVAIRATVSDSHPGYCPGCIDYVPIGLAGAAAPAGCLENRGHTGAVQTNTVTLTAPTTPGTYDVVAEANYVYHCADGWTGTGTTIAVLNVGQDPTTTSETCTPTTPAVNQSVTSTATVTPATPDTASMTGTITFYDNGTAVATVPLVNGQASYTAPYTPAGQSIYAVYSGDTNYVGSTSNTVNITSPCTTTYTGTHSSLVVTSGTTCLINATITGGISLGRGATLDVENSTVQGSISANHPATVRICGSTTGAIGVTGATGYVRIGDPASNCAPNTINGGLIAANNTGGGTISGNTITGSWIITNNTPTFTVEDNHH